MDRTPSGAVGGAPLLAEAEAAATPGAAVARHRPMPGLVVLGIVLLAVLVVPLVAPARYVVLMLPFFANCIVLLGLNLLFGYTGLLSFGHALFLGLGAYTTAYCTSQFGIRSMELIILLAVAVSLAV